MSSEVNNEKKSNMTKKKKILLVVIISIVVVCLLIATGFIAASCMSTSSVQLENAGSEEITTLEALNKPARTGFVGEKETACFRFTEKQKSEILNIVSENGHVAVTVRIRLDNTAPVQSSDLSFRYGYLYHDDFDSNGNYIEMEETDNKRTLVLGNLANAPQEFEVSFGIEDIAKTNGKFPEGFFVYSAKKCEVVAARIVPVEFGFDASREVPFYGFSCNGGVIDFSNRSFDFSGAPLIFPTKTSEKTSLPEFCIKLAVNDEYKSTFESGVYSVINFGGETIKVKNVAPASEVTIPTGGLNSPFSNMKIETNEVCITSVLMKPTFTYGKEVLKPIKTDPGLILDYRTSAWRDVDYELFEWDRYPKILFFDTRNYNVQDNFFRRMAYFVEKNGYKGRLLTNEQLEGKHGYNAHDYSAISMANFFNKAHDLNFKLNKEELLLKKILIENELFVEDGEYVKPNEGGIVSISQESIPRLRETFLAHEGWHTIFFKDEEFRNFVSAVYFTLDPDSRFFLLDYFQANPSLQYDIADDYLVQNEFMAYTMQQDISEVADYYVGLARRDYVIDYTPEFSAYVRETNARGFEDAAYAMNDFVFDKYGIVGGNISLVSK